MANLQIKGVREELYEEIKKVAKSENRSVSQRVLFLIGDFLARRRELKTLRWPADVLLELSGSWQVLRASIRKYSHVSSIDQGLTPFGPSSWPRAALGPEGMNS